MRLIRCPSCLLVELGIVPWGAGTLLGEPGTMPLPFCEPIFIPESTYVYEAIDWPLAPSIRHPDGLRTRVRFRCPGRFGRPGIRYRQPRANGAHQRPEKLGHGVVRV